jgi:7-keto-8-aminopelargonate synthetase-like enzyme
MTGARRLVRYKHNNVASLENALTQVTDREQALVITDATFSAEGELAPLPEITELVRRYGARLIVDDAHGLGVVGPDGRGTAAHFGVTDQVDLITGTFSKTLASAGPGSAHLQASNDDTQALGANGSLIAARHT